jgi:hypothetical protein
MDSEYDMQLNGKAIDIVGEYKQLALYDVFKGIVSRLLDEDTVMQE